MSLKTFHLIFIIAAILMCIGLGVWSFTQPDRMVMGVGSLVAAVVLAVYEVVFIKNFKV